MKWLLPYLLVALAAGVLLFGWGYRRGASSVEIVESVHTVPVFYEKPEPIRVTHTSSTVRVPVLLFAPADTVRETVVVRTGADSVEIVVEVERKQYGDSTYRAQVSGPRIGSLGPSLDWIETYNRTTTRSVTKRNRFALTVGAGVGFTPQGFQPSVGVQVGVVLWGF